ncbi:hypothetical protein J2T09_000801 [Neorhizobium huautlense]|uniref:t-SNARE coiled-coil homology domain-containing protein n=1 Tax=Neorhizobium huautlense TaxID=67774 RepID=A0ABT9PQC9_9HYPH|nr:hypothetical protein [Neorhizobium huautlense]MDP9836059.1 hypothetical protein [Neorhizobium huautlense]
MNAQRPSQATKDNPTHALNEQIMQSLMEIQRELSSVTTKTDRVITDIGRLDDRLDKVRSKISRFEGVAFGAGIVIVLFASMLWWLVGDQMTQIRDQLHSFQQQTTQKAP